MDLEVALVPENEVELPLEESISNSKPASPHTDNTEMTGQPAQAVTVTVTLAQPHAQPDMNMLMMNDGDVEEEPHDYQSSRKSAKQKRRSRKDLVYRVTCSVCQMKFTFASNLHRHMKNIHKKEEFCSECDYICSSKRQLILHKDLEHKPNMVREDLKFGSIKDFYDWKLKEEVTNFACYTKRRGDIEMVSSHHEFYICYLNRRTLSMTKKQSNEMHNMCPSKMLLKQSKRDGTVSVAYYKTHSHSLAFSSTQNLPMPDSLRYKIKEKLKSGLTVEEVESQLKTEHQTQLAVSIAYFNRLQKFDKVQITKIQKAMIKKGLLTLLGNKGLEAVTNKAGKVQDGIQLVMDGEMGEIVNDGEVHMDIDTSLCGPDMIFPYDVIPISITTSRQTAVPFINENGSQPEGKEAASFFSTVNNSVMSDNPLHVQVESMPLQEPEVGDASQGEDKRIEVSPVVHDMFQQIFRLLGKDSVKEMNMHSLEKSVENLLEVCKEST